MHAKISLTSVSVNTSVSLLFAALLMTGCVSGSNIAHVDSPGVQKRDEGPALCRDGTVPPCNTRS